MNPRWHPHQLVLAYVIEPKLPQATMDEYFTQKRKLCFHLGFGGSEGYGWIFPKKEHLNIGFGALMSSSKKIQDQFLRYVKFCHDLNIIPQFNLPKIQGALIPIRHILPKVYAKRTLLLGDAGGFVNPINGEGIQYAIESGEIASRIVTRIVRSGSFATKNLREYQTECMQRFGQNLKGLEFLSKILLKYPTLVIKNATKDPVLKDLALKLIQNAGDTEAIKRNLIKRFIRTLIVNAFKK